MNTKRGGCGGWLGGGAGGGGGWVGVGREGREGVVIVKIGVGCLGRGERVGEGGGGLGEQGLRLGLGAGR